MSRTPFKTRCSGLQLPRDGLQAHTFVPTLSTKQKCPQATHTSHWYSLQGGAPVQKAQATGTCRWSWRSEGSQCPEEAKGLRCHMSHGKRTAAETETDAPRRGGPGGQNRQGEQARSPQAESLPGWRRRTEPSLKTGLHVSRSSLGDQQACPPATAPLPPQPQGRQCPPRQRLGHRAAREHQAHILCAYYTTPSSAELTTYQVTNEGTNSGVGVVAVLSRPPQQGSPALPHCQGAGPHTLVAKQPRVVTSWQASTGHLLRGMQAPRLL